MARIFLIRHGETAANNEKRYQGQADTPLNRTGLRQAKTLAELLKKVPFSRIYTTPLKRAQKTALLLAQVQKKKNIMILPGLMERDFGQWEDMTFTEIKRRYPKIYAAWFNTPAAKIPGAEQFPAFRKRVLNSLRSVLKNLHTEETIAVVAHGGPNRIILHHFLGSSDKKDFWKIKQDNACVNIIELQPHYQMISLLNYHVGNFQKGSIKY
jgi:broad specificity phosphatase PhoE